MKASQLIASSLRLAGVLASGETASAADANDSLLILNDMIDSWNNERLMIFTENRQVFDLVASQPSYTVGTGGDFDIPRPPRISRYGIISLNNPAQPLELPMNDLTKDEWAAIPVKNISSALPLKVWNDLGFPLMTLYVWPIPSVAVQMAIYPWIQLSQFANLNTTDYTFPPGYARCLRYNLAVELSAEFSTPLLPQVAAIAIDSKERIKSFNEPIMVMSCDPAVVSPGKTVFNWLTGTGLKNG